MPRRPKPYIHHTCTVCGGTFESRRQKRVLCGKQECQREHKRAVNSARYRENRERWRSRIAVYAARRKDRVGKPCPDCGTVIWPTSRRCRSCASRFQGRARPGQHILVGCWACGRLVRCSPAEARLRTRVYCEECYGAQAEAARRLGVSRERVRQLVSRELRSGAALKPAEALALVLRKREVGAAVT
jgi:hypothetical protein